MFKFAYVLKYCTAHVSLNNLSPVTAFFFGEQSQVTCF